MREGQQRLVTDSVLLATELRLEQQMIALEKQLTEKIQTSAMELRKDFDTKFYWMIGLLVTTLAGVLYVILAK